MFTHGMNFQKGEEGPLFSWRTLCGSDDVSSTRQKMVLPSRLCLLPDGRLWGPVILLYP